jgi:WD40 repeat protein
MLALAGVDSVLHLRAVTGGRLGVFRGHASSVKAVAFRPEGTALVSLDLDGTLKEWDISPAALDAAALAPLARDVRGIPVSGDGRWVALIREGRPPDLATVEVREAPRGRERGRATFLRLGSGSAFWHPELSPDGSAVALPEYHRLSAPGEGGLRFRLTLADVARDRVLHLSEAELGGICMPGSSRTCFRPDGGALAIGVRKADGRSEIQLRDAGDGRVLLRLGTADAAVESLAFRPDGRVLAAGLTEGYFRAGVHTVRIWDLRDGRVLHTLDGGAAAPRTLAFSLDGGRLAAASVSWATVSSEPGQVLVWDLDRPASAPLRMTGLPTVCRQLAFSGDGGRIAAIGDNTSTGTSWLLRLWDTTGGQEVLSLSRNDGHVDGLGMSPDGRQILASLRSGSDARMMVWDSRPLPAAIEAGGLVEQLAVGKLTRSELRAAVAAEPDVPADVRAEAPAQADAWPEDRLDLLSVAQAIGGEPGRPAAELRRALRYAEAAIAILPDEEEGLYTRGLARLCLGQLVAARDDLEASARAGNDPTSWGLLALAEIQLGHRATAEAAFGAMSRRADREDAASGRAIPADLRREAERLILDAIFPVDPFVPARK